MENLRKMFMAMSKDIRVILIKIADRLHNTRTMQFQSPGKADLQVPRDHGHLCAAGPPARHAEDQMGAGGYRAPNTSIPRATTRSCAISTPIRPSARRLHEGHPEQDHHTPVRRGHPRLHLRPHQARLFHLPQDEGPEQDDRRALRPVCVPRHRRFDIPDCYNVLGHHPRPVQSGPRPLQGLYLHAKAQHVPVACTRPSSVKQGIPFEVQIRTWEMHQTAEYGIAAHWKYKQGVAGKATKRQFEWVRRLLETQQDSDAEDYIHSLKVDMFDDEVFVFTPKGKVMYPAVRLHAHRLCLCHPLRRRQRHGRRQGQQPHREL